MSAVVVLGAGAWGTAIAKVIAENSSDKKRHDVVLWCRRADQAAEINEDHTNKKYLPKAQLPVNITASTDLEHSVNGKEFLILAIPSLFIMETVTRLLDVPSIREGAVTIAIITKGFLPSPTGPRTIIETLEDYLPAIYKKALVYIAGPSHAEEVAQGKITGLISACRRPSNAIKLRYLLKGPRMLVFSSLDAQGVQVAAAVKNVIAIAFGVMDALKTNEGGSSVAPMFGDNTGSLLLAAGLSEIQSLGRAMGSTHPETFTSIAGVGDLDVTCRSIYGRNRRFGRDIVERNILGPFANIDDLIARIGEIPYTPEGVAATKNVHLLQEKYKLKMPIGTLVFKILNKENDPLHLLSNYLKMLT